MATIVAAVVTMSVPVCMVMVVVDFVVAIIVGGAAAAAGLRVV